MTLYKLGLPFLCFVFYPSISADPSFTQTPGVVKVYKGDSANLTWKLNEAIAVYWKTISFTYPEPGSPRYCTWDAGTKQFTYSPNYGPPLVKPLVRVGYRTLILQLTNIQPRYAKYNYTCTIKTGEKTIMDSSAWILLYDKPNTPVITSTPQHTPELTTITHICKAKSTTVYPQNMPTTSWPIMTYKWLRNNKTVDDERFIVSGSHGDTLIIQPVKPEDANLTLTCVAKEDGSNLLSRKDANRRILRKPGTPRPVPTVIGPYFEKTNAEITLKCELDDDGYPPATIVWTKDKQRIPFGGTTFVIPPGELTVKQHDGNWTCAGHNLFGAGKQLNISVYVNHLPQFNAELTNITLRPELTADLDVPCGIRGKPPPKVTWLYNGSTVLPPGVRVREEPNVTIDKVTTVTKRLLWSPTSTLEQRKHTTGMYTCVGKVINRENRQRFYIDVQYEPGSAKPRTNMIGPYFEHYSADIKLYCALDERGNPPAKIEWTKDGENKGITDKLYYTIPEGHLTVQQHDGLWQCTPYNRIGRGKSGNIVVTVFAKPKPKINVVSRGITPDVTKNLDVLCTCEGRPKPTVRWRFKGGPLPKSILVVNETDVIKGKLIVVSSRLKWSPTSTMDERSNASGVYTCIGNVKGNEAEQTVTIGVKYKPGTAKAGNHNLGPYYAGSPEAIELICHVTDPGFPPAMIRWIKDGKVRAITNTSYYHIPAGKLSVEEHDGQWQCEPFNSVGNGKADLFNVSVHAKPVTHLTFSNQEAQAEIRTDLDVLCSVKGRPVPDVAWLYKGGDLPSSINVSSLPDEEDGKLTTVQRRLTWSETSTLAERRKTSGVFTCVGKVDDQEDRREVNIDVLYSPYDVRITPWHNVSKAENENVSLKCSAQCNPKCTYQWTKDGGAVGAKAELNFLPIKRQDKGSYICTASNGAARHANVTVEVYSSPNKPQNFRLLSVTTHFIIIQWLPGLDGGLDQTFTVKWTDVVTGKVSQKAGLKPEKNELLMTLQIRDNIKPATRYEIEIYAQNKLGKVAGGTLVVTTQGLSQFVGPPRIKLSHGEAVVHFRINGTTSRVKAQNCVRKSQVCKVEDIIVPLKRDQEVSGTVIDYYDFESKVNLADHHAKDFDFAFWLYDGDTLVSVHPLKVHYRKISGLRILGGTLLASVLCIGIMLLAFFFCCRAKDIEEDAEDELDSKDEKSDESGNDENAAEEPDGKLKEVLPTAGEMFKSLIK